MRLEHVPDPAAAIINVFAVRSQAAARRLTAPPRDGTRGGLVFQQAEEVIQAML